MTTAAPHITKPEEDFLGKYESKNPIMRMFLRRFFETLHRLIPADVHQALEVGSGEGFSTQHLRTFMPQAELLASDVTPALVELTRQRNPSVQCSVESIFDLQRPDNSVDLVFALEVLEHLDRPADALRELARVTRKWAIISVPNEPLWRVMNFSRGKYVKGWGNTPGHLNHWTPWGFRKFTSQALAQHQPDRVGGAGFTVRVGHQPIPWIMLLLEKR